MKLNNNNKISWILSLKQEFTFYFFVKLKLHFENIVSKSDPEFLYHNYKFQITSFPRTMNLFDS